MKKSLTPFLLLFICCTSQPQQNENCYYPVKAFLTAQTYCFVNQNDKTETSCWKMHTTISGADTLFTTEIYDSKNRVIEVMTEKIKNGNSNIDSYVIYNYDSVGNKQTAECKILDSFVYKANQKQGESIQWKVSFKDFASPHTCELTKVRTLKKSSADLRIFSDRLTYNENGPDHYEFFMISTYQKGKGLVSYDLNLPNGTKNFFLTSIQ